MTNCNDVPQNLGTRKGHFDEMASSSVGDLALHYLNPFNITILNVLSKFNLCRVARVVNAIPSPASAYPPQKKQALSTSSKRLRSAETVSQYSASSLPARMDSRHAETTRTATIVLRDLDVRLTMGSTACSWCRHNGAGARLACRAIREQDEGASATCREAGRMKERGAGEQKRGWMKREREWDGEGNIGRNELESQILTPNLDDDSTPTPKSAHSYTAYLWDEEIGRVWVSWGHMCTGGYLVHGRRYIIRIRGRMSALSEFGTGGDK
ncbi:hypothetical protein DFH29DRAFT_1071447 [Suillus ampliporus]|nr:hypothetical protein DFH29DRAFT_1071447 [Suillus ampliporus]